MAAGWRWWLGIAVAAAGCRSAPPLQLESSYIPVGEVCDRLHEAMRSTDEGWISVELPAATERLVITVESRGANSATGDCGDALLAWLRASVGARPIDLRPRLQARVRALGILVSARDRWREPAAELLYGLLVDQGKPIGNLYEERQMLGPGSMSMPGWREAVTLDDLDRWVAKALRRGYALKVPMPTDRGNGRGDKYAAMLVRFFAARYAVTGSPGSGSGYHTLPMFEPEHAPPPDAASLGCTDDALDLLWPDLVRVFRASPLDERWNALPAPVVNRLRHPEAAAPCG